MQMKFIIRHATLEPIHKKRANGEKELFQCPQISGFLFYLPSTTPKYSYYINLR